MRMRAVAALVAVVVLLLQGAPAQAAQDPSAFAVSSAITVRPAVPVAVADRKASADLVAARNEFESTQVVVGAGDVTLTGVEVEIAGGALAGPAGATIPTGNITIYRQATYTVQDDFLSDGESAAGAWPDPLIPTVDPYYGQTRNAFPVNVPAHNSVAAWIDVLVPQGQAAGQYTGTITVTTEAGLLQNIPLRLRVLDFELPSTSSLDSAFQTQNASNICLAHTNTTTCGSAEKKWALHALYARAGLENRVTLSNIMPLGQGEGPPTAEPKATYFAKYILPLINGTNPTSPPEAVASAPWKAVRLPGAKLTTQGVYGYADWHCLNACVGDWEAFAYAKGYKNRLWLYACDEPGGNANLWDNCEASGLAANTALRKLVTAHPQDAKNNNDLAKVDIMVTNIRQITGKPHCCNERFEGNQRDLPVFDEFLDNQTAPSNKLWLYTACDSMGCEGYDGGRNSSNEGWDHQLWDGWAAYGIDQPSTQARMPGWLVYLYDATGELYYDATAKLRTSWTNSYFFGANGDGTLFYPGVANAGTGGPGQIIGGTDDIPIESLRLKRIRDSREDFEYLRRLETMAGKDAAMAVAKDLFGDRGDTLNASRTKAAWTTPSPQEMDRVRCDLASRIIGTDACVWTNDADNVAPDTTITNGPGPETADNTTTFQFTSSEAGSSFACSLDGAPFTPCVSPKTVTVGSGAHSLKVVATDPANNTDPTPAEWPWFVTADPAADLRLTTTALRAPEGPAFTVRSTVVNGGPDDGTALRVSTQLPKASALVSTNGTDCEQDRTVVWCVLPPLEVGDAAVVNLALRPGNEGPLTASATAVGGPPDPDSQDASDSATASPAMICDIEGTGGDNVLRGTSASEVLCGFGGNDRIEGGRGNDLIFGGSGVDIAEYSGSSAAMIVNLNFANAGYDSAWPRYDDQPGAGRDHFSSIERARGSVHGDFLLGRTGRADRLSGGAGADLMYGFGGSDVLSGGDGSDEMYGGADPDTLNGGAGNDYCRDLSDTRNSCER